MTDPVRPPIRSAHALRDSALAAAAGVAFLGLIVFVVSAWGFADAGHPVWAALFVALAAACAGGFRQASKAGSGKPAAADSDRVALERLLPLPPGTDPAARAVLKAEIRGLAKVTGGCMAAVAFGMLAWEYAASGRPEWSVVAALCAVGGATLFGLTYTARGRIR